MAVTPDGIPVSNRVDTTTERKLNAKVVDNTLNSTTYMSRVLGMAKPMAGKTYDYTIKISNSNLGQFIVGMENLTMTASDTTVSMSFAHTAFTQPIVIPMLEAFANTGPEATIDMSMFKVEEAQAEGINRMGIAIYGTGASNQPNGLENVIDDGTNASTIGGQSRTTYTSLKATVTASGGVLSLAKLGTLEDTISASGYDTETPNIHVTTKANWTLYELLVNPTVRETTTGYSSLPVRGMTLMRQVDLKGGAGFTALTYRGKPVIKDDNATTNNWYMVNERYNEWRGRTTVPSMWKSFLEKVNLGKPKTIEGVEGTQVSGDFMGTSMPSPNNGFFYQQLMILPQQAAAVARYWIIGQYCTSQPRRNGKLTGVTGI